MILMCNVFLIFNYLFIYIKVILALGDFMNVQCHACIGGQSISEDIRKLENGVHVVSGTPGRVFGKITIAMHLFFILFVVVVYSLFSTKI